MATCRTVGAVCPQGRIDDTAFLLWVDHVFACSCWFWWSGGDAFTCLFCSGILFLNARYHHLRPLLKVWLLSDLARTACSSKKNLTKSLPPWDAAGEQCGAQLRAAALHDRPGGGPGQDRRVPGHLPHVCGRLRSHNPGRLRLHHAEVFRHCWNAVSERCASSSPLDNL